MSISTPSASPILLLEHWKPVVGFESRYQVTNVGRVWSIASQKIMKPFLDRDGYLRVSLSKQGHSKQSPIHRLVGNAFLGLMPESLTTNHKNTWKRKNWVSNLEYVTNLENLHHARANGLGRNKLSYDDVRELRNLSGTMNTHSLSVKYGITTRAVRMILSREIYRDLE